MSEYTELSPENSLKLSQLIKKLFDKKDSVHFRQPVDYLKLGLFDYPKVIKKMMDLKQVKESLNDDQYESVEDCLADIQLIWDNCKIYNTEDSTIYKMAESMENHTAKLIVEYFGQVKKTLKPFVAIKPKEPEPEQSVKWIQ